VFLDWFIEKPFEKHCYELSFGRLWLLAVSDLTATVISGGLCCAKLHSAMAETLLFWSYLTSMSNPAPCKLHHLEGNCISHSVLNPRFGPQPHRGSVRDAPASPEPSSAVACKNSFSKCHQACQQEPKKNESSPLASVN